MLFSVLGEDGIIMLPLCAASAVTECGSSLVEELINGEEGDDKNTMYLSAQETVLRLKGTIFSCRGFFTE